MTHSPGERYGSRAAVENLAHLTHIQLGALDLPPQSSRDFTSSVWEAPQTSDTAQ